MDRQTLLPLLNKAFKDREYKNISCYNFLFSTNEYPVHSFSAVAGT